MKSLTKLPYCGILLLAIAANPVSAQTGLGIQIYQGTNITGSIGSIYSIQATTNVAQPNSWSTVAVVQLLATNYVWFDTSWPGNAQRFYRTVAFTNVLTNMAFIPAGTFLMGSPANEALRNPDPHVVSMESQHPVIISKGFFMGRYLVTQSDYVAVTGSNNPSYFNSPGNFNNPVEQVLRSEAANYCTRRTSQEQAAGLIPTNWVYRLPTEAEWEYACRAGSTTAFYFGSRIRSGMEDFLGTSEYDAAIGYIPNPSGANLQTTLPVGTFFANAWGLYDMAGNVAQLCYDNPIDYTNGSLTLTDPGAEAHSYSKNSNVRGGSWTSAGSDCRSARRQYANTGTVSANNIGFRVVLVPAQ